MPPTLPAPDHDDVPLTDEDRELVELHVALDLEPDGEAARLAAAAEPWDPPGA